MKEKAADILGSMAMTPPEPSHVEMDRGKEIFDDQYFQELAEPSAVPHEEEELASRIRKGKFPLIEEECQTPQIISEEEERQQVKQALFLSREKLIIREKYEELDFLKLKLEQRET
ncbi:hypothetical protein KI387_019941, partial [Taxus chinensis]